jgi:hypothetical protein
MEEAVARGGRWTSRLLSDDVILLYNIHSGPGASAVVGPAKVEFARGHVLGKWFTWIGASKLQIQLT